MLFFPALPSPFTAVSPTREAEEAVWDTERRRIISDTLDNDEDAEEEAAEDGVENDSSSPLPADAGADAAGEKGAFLRNEVDSVGTGLGAFLLVLRGAIPPAEAGRTSLDGDGDFTTDGDDDEDEDEEAGAT